MSYIEVLLLLLAGHAFADYALQSDFMAKAKNRHSDLERAIPGHWPFVLSAHSAIHGAFVGIITGVWWLGLAEAVCHWLIDFGKCEGWFGIRTDQWAHIILKIAWLEIAVAVGAVPGLAF